MSQHYSEMLRQGILAAKSGDRRRAEQIFSKLTKIAPNDKRAWWYLSYVASTRNDATKALEKVLELDPADKRARERIKTIKDMPQPSVTSPSRRNILAIGLVLFLIGVGIAGIYFVFIHSDTNPIEDLTDSEPNVTAVSGVSTPSQLIESTDVIDDYSVTISTEFQQQLIRVLELGSTLNAMTSQGVNYLRFRDQLAEVRGAYEFTSTFWPTDFSPDAKQDLINALEGWDLALYLWNLDINDKDNPVEPDINGYPLFTNYYARDRLLIIPHPDNYIVPEYRNKNHLPFDTNIRILMGIAGEDYEAARTILLDGIQAR